MSKKPNKAQSDHKETQIVEEQKDPMLRALQKKVRNINKRLNEITELTQKKDLKPEQEEKVAKKDQITQEKQKYLDMIEVYKEIASENQKLIRKSQLAELENLAAIIALKEYGVDLGLQLNQNVANLVRVLTTATNSELSLQDRVKEISTSLIQSANNVKLKKSVKEYSQANGHIKKPTVSETLSNVPEPLSDASERDRAQEIKELDEEQAEAAQTAEVLQENVTEPENSINPEPISTIQTPVISSEAVTNAVETKQEAVVENENNQITDVPKVESLENMAQKRESKNYKIEGDKGRGRGRGRGTNNGDREGGRNFEERKQYKKSFKPKYENEQPKDRSSSSESSSSEPKAREFKREEVRELIEDGFIVVGKPKVKARDQKEYYDHQHGNKYHKHHSKKNY